MTVDTIEAPAGALCEACGQAPGDWEGLCELCYDAAVAEELSCDWLDDESAS